MRCRLTAHFGDRPIQSEQDFAQLGQVRGAQRECRWTWRADGMPHERHESLMHAIAARATANLDRELLKGQVEPVEHVLGLGVAARL